MRKIFKGTVLSNKMDKTIIVGVETVKVHPRYGKRVRRQKKYYVHDEKETAQVGTQVEIEESRPRSRTKRWRLVNKNSLNDHVTS